MPHMQAALRRNTLIQQLMTLASRADAPLVTLGAGVGGASSERSGQHTVAGQARRRMEKDDGRTTSWVPEWPGDLQQRLGAAHPWFCVACGSLDNQRLRNEAGTAPRYGWGSGSRIEMDGPQHQAGGKRQTARWTSTAGAMSEPNTSENIALVPGFDAGRLGWVGWRDELANLT
ncbi:hypothetical protein LX32DRAFT_145684 [Colletotrichum zoysiae]|uniref:Uncharacterized protein n=1 Tax=Colletotrichum zoysiae TaxID=1216348 RepID=A0AAD9LZ60_9PEZI|nr:hypothetical protein LX32DRAFT_145684 [Colletotrichum zoysiae]